MFAFAATLLVAATMAQQQGNQSQNYNLPLTYETCTTADGCSQKNGSVVLDANWRWTHKTGDYTNCYTGNTWNKSFCPDDKTCAQNCAVDGVDEKTWTGTYGVNAQGDALTLGFVTKSSTGTNVGSRNYLLDEDNHYMQFALANREFTFDVDVSKLPCGLNGALYFSEMPADGGMSKYPGNKVGANYGTGYCDAQCPHDLKFINGEGNVEGWTGNPKDKNSGTGKYGSCCMEMDIWEANKVSQAVTAHPCSVTEQTRCEGKDCGDNDPSDPNSRTEGVCDKSGCDFAPYRLGLKQFYGAGSGFTIDTTKPFTVVTQFITSDGTDNTDITEIRRKWVQDGKTIDNPMATVGGKQFDSISDEFCDAAYTEFGDPNDYKKKGGMTQMGGALKRGMTLVMSLWDDHDVNMLWLDSDYPPTKDASAPGVARGTCSTDSGKPDDVEKNDASSTVTYSKIRTGEIGSTFPGGKPPGPPTPSGDKYKCEADQCVKSDSGVSIDLCNANCGTDAKYKCNDNVCTKSTDGKGLDLTTCKEMCGSYTEFLQ